MPFVLTPPIDARLTQVRAGHVVPVGARAGLNYSEGAADVRTILVEHDSSPKRTAGQRREIGSSNRPGGRRSHIVRAAAKPASVLRVVLGFRWESRRGWTPPPSKPANASAPRLACQVSVSS